MKNIIFYILIFLLFGVGNTFAASTSYSSTSGGKECQSQSRTDDSGQKYIPSSNNTSAPKSGSITCTQHGYYGGSRSSRKSKNSSYSCPSNGYASNIQWSGNSYRVYCKILDDTVPTVADITSLPLIDNAYYKANSTNITINVDNNGGAPISLIETQFEDANNKDNYLLRSVKDSSLVYQEDYSKVDVESRNDVTVNNYRPYSHIIKKVCDEAGNCANNLKTFTYNVYANNISTSQTIIDTSDLNDGTAVADGSEHTLSIHLKDQYGNNVIPVYQSNGTTLLRSVTLTTNYSNDLYMNQYTKSGNSGIQMKGSNDGDYFLPPTQNNVDMTDIISSKGYTSGIYPIKFRAYTPTSNAYDKAIGGFLINTIQSIISDVTGETTLLSLLNMKFNPLYKVTINGSVKSDGFIEGGTQTGTLSVSGGGVGTRSSLTSNKNIYIEFGSGAINEDSPYLDIEQKRSTSYSLIGEGNGNRTLFQSNFSSINYPIETLLTLSGGFLSDLDTAYLSTHVSYSLDGNNIVYNTDIIGKSHYWGDVLGGDIIQKGIKILGNTHSQKQVDIIENQQESDIHIVGNIEKSGFQKEMRKKVFDMIRSVIPNNGSRQISDLDGDGINTNIWDNSDGRKLLDGTILYFGDLNGQNVNLNVSQTHTFIGKKTIVVTGGNLYIQSNIISNSNSDILGIIVLKDDNGNGGNIYIHPSVTRVDGILYTDKSLISYNGTELDGSTQNSVIANQLYIYGSVFSENTIGGSRELPPVCPYYIKESICSDVKQAQKYDLNYLRRYFIKTDGTPVNGGVNYFGIYDSSYEYYTFPVVVKYNSKVQLTPPPLFEQE